MTQTTHRPEASHHLLIHHQNGNQNRQGPQQGVAEVLTGLRVGRHATGVVIAHHHDEAGADNGEEGQ